MSVTYWPHFCIISGTEDTPGNLEIGYPTSIRSHMLYNAEVLNEPFSATGTFLGYVCLNSGVLPSL